MSDTGAYWFRKYKKSERDRMLGTKPILVSVKEACRLLSVCRSTLEKYIAMKEIQSRKLGKKRLVVMQSLESFAKRDHSV